MAWDLQESPQIIQQQQNLIQKQSTQYSLSKYFFFLELFYDDLFYSQLTKIELIFYYRTPSLQLEYSQQNKMTRNVNHPPKLKMVEQDIQPWNVQDSTPLNFIQSNILRHYQPITHKTISFNPEISQASPIRSKKSTAKAHNFFDNLRKYESKKAEQFPIKRDKNFIQKNKQKLVEDFMIHSQQSKNDSMLISDLFANQKTIRTIEQKICSGAQPINWSLIMYYETQKNKSKPKHRDIQSFLRFQAQRKERASTKQRATRENPQKINEKTTNKYEEDNFQRILKLKQGIRRRNLKSTSSSSKITIEESQIEIDQLRQSQNHSHRAYGFVEFQKRVIPKTSYSARVPKKDKTNSCKIEIIGNKNALIAKKQPLSELRTIHSSQKSSRLTKLLNVNISKLQSSKNSNNTDFHKI